MQGGERICTTDFALMYDGVADFPQWLANPVAVSTPLPASSTSTAPIWLRTGTIRLGRRRMATPRKRSRSRRGRRRPTAVRPTYCQRVDGSDTIYITLPARYLPLYQPFVDLGDATGTSALIVPVTDFLSPFTQTIIETGYDRTNYATPQPGTILPPKTFNPIKTAVDLVNDIPEGINMALTPGRTPLPGSPPLPATAMDATTLSDTNTTNTIVSKSTTPNLGTPDIRLGIFAKPGRGRHGYGCQRSEHQSAAAECAEGLPPGARRGQGGLRTRSKNSARTRTTTPRPAS